MRFYKDKVSPYELDQYGRLNPDADEIYVIGGNYNEKNDHITDLDAIELSSGWNYNDKITLSDEIHVNGNKYKVIKDQNRLIQVSVISYMNVMIMIEVQES